MPNRIQDRRAPVLFMWAIGSCCAAARPSAVGPGGPIPDLGMLETSVTMPAGVVGNVTVDLLNLQHTWSGDLVVTLSHNGTSASLLNRLGRHGGAGFGSPSPFAGNYSFADGGADMWAISKGLPFGDPIPEGTYRPSGEDNAPVSLQTIFGGTNAGGDWLLTIIDSEEEDEGSLDGWRLNVEFVPAPGAGCVVMGAAAAAGARRRR